MWAVCIGETGAGTNDPLGASETSSVSGAISIVGTLAISSDLNAIAAIVAVGAVQIGVAEWGAVLGSLLGIIEEAKHVVGALREEVRRTAALTKRAGKRVGEALPARGTDLTVITIGRIGIRGCWTLSAIIAGASVDAGTVEANMS